MSLRKRTILMIAMIVLTLGVSAQSFNALWKQEKTAEDKDQPKTALAAIKQIRQKAEKEGDYGNILAAMMRELALQREVSNDSLKAARERLDRQQKVWRENGHGVEATLVDVALQRITTNYVDSLLASPDSIVYTRAGKALNYNPFMTKGADSKYFDNDLLSTIIMAHQDGMNSKAALKLLERQYGRDNKVVDWLTTRYKIDHVKVSDDKTHKLELIDKAIEKWSGWKEINELVNMRADMTQPEFWATITNTVTTSRDDVMVYFTRVRNLKNADVIVENEKGVLKTIHKTFNIQNECNYIKDSLNIGTLPCGKWTIRVESNEVTRQEYSQKTEIYVTDMKVIRQALNEGTLFIVVDAKTGESVSGAVLRVRPKAENGRESQETRYTVGDDGQIIIKGVKYSALVAAIKGNDNAMPMTDVYNGFTYVKSPALSNYLKIYTDRAIYRRGQKVHVNALCYSVIDGVTTKPQVNRDVTLTFYDNRRKIIATKVVMTDKYGSAATDFDIPQEGTNGTFSITGNTDTNAIAIINVEDYKRPTFEVELVKPEEDYHVGDTVMVKGSAKMYSGVPVANARVTYRVARRNCWFWCKYIGDGHREDGYEMRDTVYTDGDGNFTVKMPMVIPENVDTTWYYHYDMVADVTVMDKAGESHSKSIDLPLENEAPKADKTPEKPKDFELSAEVFAKNDDEAVTVTLRNAGKNVTAYYTICAADNIVETYRTQFSDSTTISIRYKKEYGDGVMFNVAWVKDNTMHRHSASIKKYLPSAELKMEWGTFRDKLVPGQKETWTLKVTDKEGKAVKSQLMAVLYDKTLDAILRREWTMTDNRSLSIPVTRWTTSSFRSSYINGLKQTKYQDFKSLEFNAVAGDFYFWDYADRGIFYNREETLVAKPMMLMSAKADAETTADNSKAVVGYSKKAVVGSYDVIKGVSQNQSADAASEIALRSDFSETAFFMPQLMTDDKGVAMLRFTLPQSVTKWAFRALAHDTDMRFAIMEDEAMTQKQLMVQPKMPRFLRSGDKALINATVANMSDKPQTIKVNFAILDAATEKVLATATKTVKAPAGKTTEVNFPYNAPKQNPNDSTQYDVICRFTAEMPGFSDGEQHLIPILQEMEEKVDTTSFVVSPKKIMLEALPKLQEVKSQNAISLAHAIYANVIAANLTDTTYVKTLSKTDIQGYKDSAKNMLYQLIYLQNADGGFSWYKGMASSCYITIEVLKTLSRLNVMCGEQKDTETMMGKAFTFAQKEMEKEMTYMKKHDYKYLSNTSLDWLYTLSIANRNGGSAESFFRKMVYGETKKEDMHTKAVAAITMFDNGQKNKAREFVEAIKQHTVFRSDMGRYFDSYRADYSWCDYRIPTHTMCIEAMNEVTPNDNKTITEMIKWLVQSKRTQRWDNPINAVNAIYAFHNAKDTTVLADFVVNPEELKGALKITRELYSASAASMGKKIDAKDLKMGDRVKVRLVIEADRDYDFITITDNRPAYLEPRSQVSGYRSSYSGGFYHSYYQEMRDSKSVYHFDKMNKGTHVIETEYYVDRDGNYAPGKAMVVCEYAPEFRGETIGYK